MLNPNASSFVIKRSCKRKSNSFDKYVRSAPNDLFLSVIDFHFSSIDSRQC